MNIFKRSRSVNDISRPESTNNVWTPPSHIPSSEIKGGDFISPPEHRVKMVGELLELLNNKQACSVSDIDNKLSACLNTYSQTMSPSANHNLENMFLTVNRKKTITPPTCLSTSTKATSLDRFSKIDRVFRSVPVFNNTDMSIVDFLHDMSAVVTELNCDITEGEFKYVLLSKLSPKVKSVLLASRKNASLAQIYEFLSSIYDLSPTERDTFATLVAGKTSHSNLTEYLEHTLKLISNIQSDKEAINALLYNLKFNIPPRIYDRVTDYVDSYENLKSSSPPIEKILGVLFQYRSDIDKHMSSKGQSRFNEVKTDGQLIQTSQLNCSYCGKSNHSEAICYRKMICSTCNKIGHTKEVCKVRPSMNRPINRPLCTKCGRQGHVTSECIARCRLCNSESHNAVHCPLYTSIEPAQSPCSKCLANTFIRLYHPTNSCRQFNSAKNGC